MLDKKIITANLSEMLNDFLHLEVIDDDANLFSSEFLISPIAMVYLLLEIEKKFSICINDRFFDNLSSLSISSISEAIIRCAE